MPQSAPEKGRSRLGRYRDNKRRRGMRLLRIWVPDPHAPGFAAEALRQAKIINDAADATEVMDFIAQTADWGDER